jgi:hypothetical protein
VDDVDDDDDGRDNRDRIGPILGGRFCCVNTQGFDRAR